VLLRDEERGCGKERRDHLGQSTFGRAVRFELLLSS
jgi:hypothetical protein